MPDHLDRMVAEADRMLRAAWEHVAMTGQQRSQVARELVDIQIEFDRLGIEIAAGRDDRQPNQLAGLIERLTQILEAEQVAFGTEAP